MREQRKKERRNLKGKKESSENEEKEGATSQQSSVLTGFKDQIVGGVKEKIGSATGNPNLELTGKAQSVHGRNEKEYARAEKEGLAEPERREKEKEQEHTNEQSSALTGLKDQIVGGAKEKIGTATGNPNLELTGKAQSVHGRNEKEYARAEKEGLAEPERRKDESETRAEGICEGENNSVFGSLKDRAVGTVKETLGAATGNEKMELMGKAQSTHGRNEANLAQKDIANA